MNMEELHAKAAKVAELQQQYREAHAALEAHRKAVGHLGGELMVAQSDLRDATEALVIDAGGQAQEAFTKEVFVY